MLYRQFVFAPFVLVAIDYATRVDRVRIDSLFVHLGSKSIACTERETRKGPFILYEGFLINVPLNADVPRR